MNQNRPTPAHLTSVQAEQILAQACENESHNAKRMRLGLDPVSQPMPVIPGVRGTNDLMLGLVMNGLVRFFVLYKYKFVKTLHVLYFIHYGTLTQIIT